MSLLHSAVVVEFGSQQSNDDVASNSQATGTSFFLLTAAAALLGNCGKRVVHHPDCPKLGQHYNNSTSILCKSAQSVGVR